MYFPWGFEVIWCEFSSIYTLAILHSCYLTFHLKKFSILSVKRYFGYNVLLTRAKYSGVNAAMPVTVGMLTNIFRNVSVYFPV